MTGLPRLFMAIGPDDRHDIARWFARSRPALVHVHAGIGWTAVPAPRTRRPPARA